MDVLNVMRMRDTAYGQKAFLHELYYIWRDAARVYARRQEDQAKVDDTPVDVVFVDTAASETANLLKRRADILASLLPPGFSIIHDEMAKKMLPNEMQFDVLQRHSLDYFGLAVRDEIARQHEQSLNSSAEKV